MKELLKKLNKKGITINPNLLNPAFIEWEGCILLKSPQLKLGNFADMIYFDKTGIETFNNHIHLDNIAIGIEILNLWESKLSAMYKDKPFIFVLSSNLEGEDVVLRFYQYRSDEPEWMDRSNLDNYKEEAILIIEHLKESH